MKSLYVNAHRSVMSLLLVGMVAVSAPAMAQNLADASTADNTTAKKPSRVQVTNLANGEVGCHDNVNNVSTPGPCPGTNH